MVNYTTIIHDFRLQHNLSCNEYVLCDYIDFLSTSRKYSDASYSKISREELAIDFGITKRGIIFMIDRLVERGFLEKEEKTGKIRSTEKWQEVRDRKYNKSNFSGEKSSPKQHELSVKKVHQNGEKSSPKNEIIPYIVRNKDIYTEFFKKEDVFEKLYELYDNKKGKAAALKKFLKIKPENYQKIFDAVPYYLKDTPDVQYRKHLVTWLNQEGWGDYENMAETDLFSNISETNKVQKLEDNEW